MAIREVLHIVLFRWEPGTTEEQVARVRAELLSLADGVPGILELSCGENFCPRSQGYQTALVVRFADRDALEAYSPHPLHRRVVEQFINPIRADSLAVDYELG